MESFKKRLKRYTDNEDLEIFGWLTVYLHNVYWSEIQTAKENRLYHCVYLLTHALMQMISENLFGLTGKDGTKFYLENFVDGDTPDTRFSLITDEIHDARNVMAHQGYSSLQHRVEYFANEIDEGWKNDGDSVLINPRLYADRFEAAFRQGSLTAEYEKQTDEVRTVRKYQYIRQWLRLDSKNPITIEIKKLEGCATLKDIRIQETVIQKMIYASYDLA